MSWPDCFDTPEQWAAWVKAARQYPPPKAHGYCSDCTPTYKAEMMKWGRCEHPTVRFVIRRDGDGVDIEGRRGNL